MSNPFTIDNNFSFIDTSNLQSVERDNQQAYMLLRLIVTPFEKYKAYKYGIIDKNGNELRPYNTLKTYDEKKSYSRLVRLMIAVKKIINKYPQEKYSFQNIYRALKSINENEQFKISKYDIFQEEIYKIKLISLIDEEISVSTSSIASYDAPMNTGDNIIKRKKNKTDLESLMWDEVWAIYKK